MNNNYKTKLVEGTEVMVEESGRNHRKAEDGKLQVDVGHQDWITDILQAHTTQRLLVTAANDGVIKMWK